jgi:tRNA threonylcarbamoyladenosine modification (KEOPS) complex Cgi121 subunit
LLFELPDLAKHVWISAFEGSPDIEHVLRTMNDKAPDLIVQLVDLDKVAGTRYLRLATFSALKSFQSNHAIAKSLAMEILLYIAADRQIGEALKRVGVSSDTKRVAAVVVGKSKDRISTAATLLSDILSKENKDDLLDEWSTERLRNVRSLFDIGEKELKAVTRRGEKVYEAVERLAIERSAMITIKK